MDQMAPLKQLLIIYIILWSIGCILSKGLWQEKNNTTLPRTYLT